VYNYYCVYNMCICELYINNVNLQRQSDRYKQTFQRALGTVTRKHSEVPNTVNKHHVVSRLEE